jgi:hypothetical protein
MGTMRAKLGGSLAIFWLLAICGPARGAPRAAAAPSRPWTLILQLPANRSIRVERSGETLTGPAPALAGRLRRSGARATRRVMTGTVSVESNRVREIQLAGNVLILTAVPSPNKQVRLFSTNRLPMSDDPTRRMLLNLQLVAEGELHARASFAVIDELGRTAVLFQ